MSIKRLVNMLRLKWQISANLRRRRASRALISQQHREAHWHGRRRVWASPANQALRAQFHQQRGGAGS